MDLSVKRSLQSIFHFKIISFAGDGEYLFGRVLFKNDPSTKELLTAVIEDLVATKLTAEQVAELFKLKK